jgi:signal transduction histidine kinase
MRRLSSVQALTYLALALIVAAGYAMAVAGASLLLGGPVRANNPVLIGLLALALALGLNPLYGALRRAIAEALFIGSQARQTALAALQADLDAATGPEDIARRIRAALAESLQPEAVHVFLLDSDSRAFAASPSGPDTSSQLRLSQDGPLAQALTHAGGPLAISPETALAPELAADRSNMAVLGAVAYAPIRGDQDLLGWVALGPAANRGNGKFTSPELSFVQDVARLAAGALIRTRAMMDLRQRIQQLDTLGQVAQAVNLAQAELDLIDLVGRSVQDLVFGDDFIAALRKEDGQTLQVYLRRAQGGIQRLDDIEAETQLAGLLGTVIESSAPVRTDDYRGAALSYGRLADLSYRAWLGVPLKSGQDVLGALALASRAPGAAYSEEQLKILSAVADQAANGLLRTRLYRQIETRAQQLATLNQIGADLTRTLEFDPLLHQIMSGVLSLVGCEAGQVALFEEGTDSLVVRVSAGPGAQAHAGHRLSSHIRVIDLAFQLRKPVSGLDDGRLGMAPEDTAGGEAAGVLAVPLLAKGKPSGIILIRNRPGLAMFSDSDVALLSAFAAQASIALENARLYTLTDRALEAKVDQLSVMQTIDRELNASLDLERALAITLDWAVEHTGSLAGAVIIRQENNEWRAFEQGFGEAAAMPDAALELRQLPLVEAVLQSGEPVLIEDIATDSGPAGRHPKARALAALPIRREGRAIGGLYVEHSEARAYDEDRLAFLQRLTEHASIAITNALLYAQVQSANLAKSEFISFISHELRTPMTSIKGYSDLLAQETVGTINQAQAEFLGTIRSNADRMASLVSDLADISRIESGRLKLEFEALELSEVVEEVVRSGRQRMQAKGHRIVFHGLEQQPAAWADRTRLIQVLANLLSNATKYTPNGGEIHLSVEAAENSWDSKGAPRVLHVAVSDTGIGIPLEERHLVFQKFFRSESPQVREAPGTGLGLSITKYLVELQGGRIWFETEAGKGTTFHFTVPLVEDLDRGVQQLEERQATSA